MSEVTVGAGLQRYLREVSILKRGYGQEKFRIEQLCRSPLGAKIASEVTSVDVATYRDQRLQQLNPRTKKPLSPATVRLELSLLSNFFDIGRIEWGICGDNPVKNVRKPPPAPGRDRRLTAREERQIMRYCFKHSNRELLSIVVLALETAMRQGEILALSWEHINLKSRIAHLPQTKNGTKRDVPLSVKARDALVRLGVQSKGKVFSYTSAGLKSTWRYMLQQLEIENLHFHDVRHESVSRLFELGSLDMMEVAAISGHKSLAMLKRYTHLRATRLVPKLEGHRNKGKQVVLDNLIPYPASIQDTPTGVQVRLLDFHNLTVEAPDRGSAIRQAGDALLRQLMRMLKDSIPIPSPDQYLDPVDDHSVHMIDPLYHEAA